MRELTIYRLYEEKKKLQNTWNFHTAGKDCLSVSPRLFNHLHKRYTNIDRIIKRKRKDRTLKEFCKQSTYQVLGV